MASQTPDTTSTCVMCFESRTLKVVGRCKHSFCAECLSSTLEGKEEVFQCPTCRSDCPRPWNGVDGLVDLIGDRYELTELDVGTVATAKENESRGEEQIICEVCCHKIKEKVKAVNICQECDHLNICQACSEKHKKSKVTRHHILTPLVIKTQQKASKCDLHNKNLTSFCQTCNTSICNICVLTDHEDHDAESIGETISREVEKTNLTLDEMERNVKMLENLQQKLVVLNAIAPQVDNQDMLFKQIEDRAQEVIDHVIRWKEDLKQEVRVKYQIIRDIQDDLRKVSEMVKKFWSQINQGRELLSKSEYQLMYLEKLFALKRELEQTEEMGNGLERRNYSDILHELRDEDNIFQVNRTPVSPGKIVRKYKSVDFKLEEIFHHTIGLPADEDMFIPCVATIGTQSYAVAHPVTEKGLPAAIDVYDYDSPGILKLRDHVPPFHDMSTTPDNQLALLCTGKDRTGCKIQVLDPETGNITSTHDIISGGHPISLGVTTLYQFVILESIVKQQTQITVTDRDGTVKHTCRIDEGRDDLTNPRMISCGGRFIFVGGEDSVAVYEIQDRGIQRITARMLNVNNIHDIAATIWDDVFFTIIDIAPYYIVDDFGGEFVDDGMVFLNILQDDNTLEWPINKHHEIYEFTPDVEEVRQVRVATASDGNTIIVTHDQTIKVYRHANET